MKSLTSQPKQTIFNDSPKTARSFGLDSPANRKKIDKNETSQAKANQKPYASFETTLSVATQSQKKKATTDKNIDEKTSSQLEKNTTEKNALGQQPLDTDNILPSVIKTNAEITIETQTVIEASDNDELKPDDGSDLSVETFSSSSSDNVALNKPALGLHPVSLSHINPLSPDAALSSASASDQQTGIETSLSQEGLKTQQTKTEALKKSELKATPYQPQQVDNQNSAALKTNALNTNLQVTDTSQNNPDTSLITQTIGKKSQPVNSINTANLSKDPLSGSEDINAIKDLETSLDTNQTGQLTGHSLDATLQAERSSEYPSLLEQILPSKVLQSGLPGIVQQIANLTPIPPQTSSLPFEQSPVQNLSTQESLQLQIENKATDHLTQTTVANLVPSSNSNPTEDNFTADLKQALSANLTTPLNIPTQNLNALENSVKKTLDIPASISTSQAVSNDMTLYLQATETKANNSKSAQLESNIHFSDSLQQVGIKTSLTSQNGNLADDPHSQSDKNQPELALAQIFETSNKHSDYAPSALVSSLNANGVSASTSTPLNVSASGLPVLQSLAGDATDQVIEGASYALKSGKPEIVIKLNPDNLGDVSISLKVNNSGSTNQITAKLIVSNPDTQDVLQKQLHTLKQSLEQQGVRVDTITVTLSAKADTNPDSQKHSDDHSQNPSNQQFNHQQHQQSLNQQHAQQAWQQAFGENRQQQKTETIQTTPSLTQATDPTSSTPVNLGQYNPDGSISVFA